MRPPQYLRSYLLGVLKRSDRQELLEACTRILPAIEWEGGLEHPPATNEELIHAIKRRLNQ